MSEGYRWPPDANSMSTIGKANGLPCVQEAVDTDSQPLVEGVIIAVGSLLPSTVRSLISWVQVGLPGASWDGADGGCPGAAQLKCPGVAPPGPGTHPLSTRKESRQTLIFFFK